MKVTLFVTIALSAVLGPALPQDFFGDAGIGYVPAPAAFGSGLGSIRKLRRSNLAFPLAVWTVSVRQTIHTESRLENKKFYQMKTRIYLGYGHVRYCSIKLTFVSKLVLYQS